ncbi:S-adenosyl-L-methionine-dependent methyltransferase-like protein [Rhypophila decipiens]|uniref:S-adenosyl-L-methionine-dependent methyltransferase-like protein n=1 Tax=Rhypophila decipiens TaxID=261697 RepID=A0AAN7B6M6_9PEZI|nr:S-adenosyl-L-methionine-dependent methyltransferase-like protein [Rhypophila decipiens]
METSDSKPVHCFPSKSLPMSSPEETDQTESAQSLIRAYLLENLEVYRELCELRDAGHESNDADVYFQNQRSKADHASVKTQMGFLKLMQSIGLELDDATSALKIRRPGMPRPAILDLCMAPGGFALAALQRNNPRSALLRGISLPPSEGGHVIRLRDVSSTKEDVETASKFVDYRDITPLAEEMGVSLGDIPPSHPDAAMFSSDRPYFGSQFDLVFCDGQVLRTHERGEHRADHEAGRLLTSQLVLALQRIRPGGTMIILLHRANSWSTIRLIYTFDLFSDSIQLFKPTKAHRMRGSFYLVAKGVQPVREAALEAVQRWKAQWKFATFGGEVLNERELEVQFVIDAFGSRLLALVEPVFRVQMEALRNAPWMKKGVVTKSTGDKGTRQEEEVGKSKAHSSVILQKEPSGPS